MVKKKPKKNLINQMKNFTPLQQYGRQSDIKKDDNLFIFFFSKEPQKWAQ